MSLQLLYTGLCYSLWPVPQLDAFTFSEAITEKCVLDIQSNYVQKNKQTKKTHYKSTSSLLKENVNNLLEHKTLKTDWQRILNVCKSSWLTCIEVKWDVDIYYWPIAAKLTPQILRPEHRKYKYDSTDIMGNYPHHQPLVTAGRAAEE